MKRWTWTLLCFALVAFLVGVPVAADDDVEQNALDVLPYRYAWVRTKDAPVFDQTGDPAQLTPIDRISSGDVWVSLKQVIWAEDRLWYAIGGQRYMLASDLWLGPPSNLYGRLLDHEGQTQPLGFVLENGLEVKAQPSEVQAEPALDVLNRYTQVSLFGRVTADGGSWYQIGPQRYVRADLVRVVVRIERPKDVGPEDKWVAVNLAEQTLVAYEGDEMVFATLVSTGARWTPTPQGLFRPWIKIRLHNMSGSGYVLADVPWATYFHGSYALHTSYWHDGFGYVRSHGCVNLSPLDAKWLFEWMTPVLPRGYNAVRSGEENPGTWVYVYNSPAGPALPELH